MLRSPRGLRERCGGETQRIGDYEQTFSTYRAVRKKTCGVKSAVSTDDEAVQCLRMYRLRRPTFASFTHSVHSFGVSNSVLCETASV